MRTFTEVFAAIEKKVASPDGNIVVTLTGGTVTDAEFRPGTFPSYDKSSLEEQIVALIKLVIVARKRSRREAIIETLGHVPIRWEPTAKDLEYRERLKEIEGEAHSSRISIYALPGEFWDVEIRPDSLAESSSSDFLQECLSVASEALSDMQRKVRVVNEEIFGHIGDIGHGKSESK